MSAVDWHAVPGPVGWYEPDSVGSALRELAAATSVLEASAPSSVLYNTGLLHEHSGTVYPAAAFAAPTLLDIVENGHPIVRAIAADLLTAAMELGQASGRPRVAAVPVCCAVAAHVHARGLALTEWPALRREADRHWRFEVREALADGADTVAFGTLWGRLPPGDQRAELHGEAQPVAVRLEDGDLRVFGAVAEAGDFLLPAECGSRQ